jgi:hypothetical protein
MRNDGVDAYEAVMKATAHLHEDDRGDVMSRMYVAIGEGCQRRRHGRVH